jgi:hypothetical protein
MLALEQIPGAVEVRIGMPRVDWQVVWAWIENHVPEERQISAWEEFGRGWLELLRDALGGNYVVEESEHFMLLGDGATPTNELVVSWCEHYRHRILQILAGVETNDPSAKRPILLFHDRAAYLDYIMDLYPVEGEFADSGGMFVGYGLPHVALWGFDSATLERTIAHELTHAAMADLPLPLWLNEGVTRVVEDVLLDQSHFWMNGEIAREHKVYWNSETIQAFWSGESFHAPGDVQRLSYSLAEVIVRNLASDHPGKLPALLNTADACDAGERALQDVCKTTLAKRVAQFLGPGEWGMKAEETGQ